MEMWVVGAEAIMVTANNLLENPTNSASQEYWRPHRWRFVVMAGAMVGLWRRKSSGDGGHDSCIDFLEDEG